MEGEGPKEEQECVISIGAAANTQSIANVVEGELQSSQWQASPHQAGLKAQLTMGRSCRRRNSMRLLCWRYRKKPTRPRMPTMTMKTEITVITKGSALDLPAKLGSSARRPREWGQRRAFNGWNSASFVFSSSTQYNQEAIWGSSSPLQCFVRTGTKQWQNLLGWRRLLQLSVQPMT